MTSNGSVGISAVVMHYCDIFRATRSSFISCYTYFGELFCQTHFLRHIFSHLFCETSAYRRTHFRIFERKHTLAPLLFCRPIAESVWAVAVQSIYKKSALPAHTVAIEAQKHKTRFKQERLCVSLSFSCLVLVLMVCTAQLLESTRQSKPCNNDRI